MLNKNKYSTFLHLLITKLLNAIQIKIQFNAPM